MGQIKKLSINGTYVCDYESTGDDMKDAELCLRLLKEKGLYQHTTTEQAYFRQAMSFATTSAYLYNKDLSSGPRNVMSIAPFVVNAAFALELYLKTLGRLNNVTLHGHDLLDLYDKLPSSARDQLPSYFAGSKWQGGIADLQAFREAVSELRSAFVDWRYLHEKEQVRRIEFRTLIFVMDCFHQACQAFFSNSVPNLPTPSA